MAIEFSSGSSKGKTSDFGSENSGSNPLPETKRLKRSSAVERDAVNVVVEGSNPSASANIGSGLLSAIGPGRAFINASPVGLKVKMPDSVHIFLPGETIEFLPKELGEDGADRELARRARRAEMKSKASMDWAKRNKGDRRD